MSADFPRCAVCGGERWRAAWRGKVRAGKFGSFTEPTEIRQCEGCGVQRLAEGACQDESFYASGNYREFLGQGKSAASFHAEHDPLQLERLNICRPHTLRGKTLADIGCAGGSFLDHVRGLAAAALAIEPAEHYHPVLAKNGYHVFASIKAAHKEWRGRIERAFSFSVIEHLAEPPRSSRRRASCSRRKERSSSARPTAPIS